MRCLYIIIVVLNTQRFVVFAPKIGEFGGWNGIYNTRKRLYYKIFPREWFFWKKLCVLNIVLKKCSILRIVIYCLCAENSIFLPKYLRMCIFCCTSDICLAEQFPRSYVRSMQPILQRRSKLFIKIGYTSFTSHYTPTHKQAFCRCIACCEIDNLSFL